MSNPWKDMQQDYAYEKKRRAIGMLLKFAEKEKDPHRQRVLFEAAQKIGGKRK